MISDLMSLSELKWEVFYVRHRSWLDPIGLCPIYLGIDVLTDIALVFFIVAFNFHSICTYNQYIANDMQQILEENIEDDFQDDEFDDFDTSCDSFVEHNQSTSPELQNYSRSIVIDYGKKKSEISVFQPIIFIWLVAISMCIPFFCFGRIIPSVVRDSNERMCGLIVMDQSNSFILQILLLKMRIIVPSICLILSTLYVIKVLLVETDEDLKQILKLALSLSLTYMLFTMQRLYGSIWFELVSRPMMEYKYARIRKWFGVAGCLIHYWSIIIRPILYVRYNHELRKDFKKRFCCIYLK